MPVKRKTSSRKKASSVQKTPAKKNTSVSPNAPNWLGSWAFIIGVVLAIVLGIGYTGKYQSTILWIVFALGIVVGILNISIKETHGFLLAGTVLVLVSFLGVEVGVFSHTAESVVNMLKGILTLFVPATLIVALRTAFTYARN